MNEIIWQNAIKRYFEENDVFFISQNGKAIHILSIGEHNHFEGPDFKNSCVIITSGNNSETIIGDIEFHKKSSNWIEHNHSNNPSYSNVIVHICFEDDKKFDSNFETIVLDKKILTKYTKIETHQQKYDTSSYDDFQEFAMLRLLRRTTNIYHLLENLSVKNTLIISTTNFLTRYLQLRTRNIYHKIDIDTIIQELLASSIIDFILNINNVYINVEKEMQCFLQKNKNLSIKKHLKQEIFTNSILPIAFCIADNKRKSELLLWYWNAKTNSKYGILSQKYPLISQKYIWQQQGMLEYYKEYNNKQHSKRSDLLSNYSIPNIISYYTLNKPPYFLANYQ